MAAISAIRADLALRLVTVLIPGTSDKLRAGDLMRDAVSPPIALIEVDNIDWDLVYARAADTYTFKVLLLVSRSSERAGQNLLDAFCAGSGTSSVKEAIETATAGETAGIDWVNAKRVENFGREFTIGEIGYLGCEFVLEVVA